MKKVYLFLLVLGLVVGLTGCESEEMKAAKDNYNNEVERISDQEEKRNMIISKCFVFPVIEAIYDNQN